GRRSNDRRPSHVLFFWFVVFIKRRVDLLIRPVGFTHGSSPSIERLKTLLLIGGQPFDQFLFGNLEMWMFIFLNHSYSFHKTRRLAHCASTERFRVLDGVLPCISVRTIV